MAKNTRNNTIFAKVSPPFGHPLSFDHMCIQYLNKSTLSLYSKPKFSRAILERNEVFERTIVIVEICVQPCCLKQTLKENKHSSFRWFSEEHFTRLISKLEDVILARVMAPPEKSKKKNGKTSRCESHETLPDSELLINYQFVKRRKCRQTVLIRSKQELHGKYEGKNVKDSEYSGGGYQSLNFFPEKLKVTVGQISLDSLIMQSESGVTENNKEGKPLKSVISKYFNKHDSGITHSTQKKKAALKNMNKKDDPQKKLDSLCTASSSIINRFTLEQKGKKPSGSAEVEGESKQGNKQISWMTNLGDPQETLSRQEGLSSKGRKEKEVFTLKKEDENDAGLKNLADEKFQLDDKADIQDSTVLQGVLNSVEGNKECYKNKILVHTDDSGSEACGSADTGNAASCASQRREKLQTAVDAEDATSKCNTIHQTFIVEEHSKSKTSGTKLKRPRSDSESDSRLSKKTTLKKRTAKTKGMRKESDSDCVTVDDENDFESPKVRRIVEKRQGSDLIEGHAQCSEQYNQSRTSSDVMESLGTKKRKTGKASATGDTSYKRSGRPAKRKVNKRPLRTTSKTCDILEDLDEEPGSSPLEPITIEDKPPVALDVSTIEDLTLDQTEQLVWELASELREIFEGKRYCRRHEDYKRGGRMRGDLAFQVQFGQFTEEQRDIIMDVLTAMFCYKHSKYFDYVSKVLLPETLVMLYMKVVGRTRDEAELSLLERAK